MRLTFNILAAYLLVAVLPLLVEHPDGVGVAVAMAHLASAGVLLQVAGRVDGERVGVWSWLPLMLVPLLYAELPLLNQWAGPGYHDAVVQGWDRALFGFEPATGWAARMPYRPWSEVLHLAYLSYFALIYLPQIPLQVRGRAHAFHTQVLGVILAFVVCYLCFIAWPVQGPRYLGAPAGVPDGPIRRLTLAVLERGSSRGAAFPSSHVAVAAAQAFMAVRYQRPWGWGVALLATLLAAGAVYGGFHYGVDALLGAATGLAAASAAVALRERSGAASPVRAAGELGRA